MAAWPPTRLQLRTEIRRILQDTSSVAAEQDVADATLNDAIDQAIRTVQVRLGRGQGIVERIIAPSQGQFLYTLPVPPTVSGAARIHQVRFGPLTTTNLVAHPTGFTDRSITIDRILRPLTQTEGRLRMGGGAWADNAVLGEPWWWWPEGEGQASVTTQAVAAFGIWPAPGADEVARRLTVRFDSFGGVLAADADVLMTPPGSDVAVENLVASWVKGWIGDLRESLRLGGIYEQVMAALLPLFSIESDEAPERPVDHFAIL